jgi:methylamine dehydrogenase heavy chain
MMRGSACLAALLASILAGASHAELPVEHITVAQMPPDNGHRLYVVDGSVAHGVDGKLHVIDGDTFRILGQFSNGFFGDFLPAAHGGTLYNATTFFSRGDHGTHTEVLEYFDPKTLMPTGETVLPPKRAQSNGISALMAETVDGAFLMIQNATPATSVTLVDTKSRKVVAELPNAGCYGIYPSATKPGRFSSLCGDGGVLTVDFDADGRETGRHRSPVFFDPDGDALFLQSVQVDAHRTAFLSFLGSVHVMDLSGETATQEAPWSILTGVAGSAGWRPGGEQLIAYSAATGMLYVAMHPNGKEGSHKDPAAEIWKVDLARKAVVARGKSDAAICIEVSQDAKPVLFTESGTDGSLSRFDGDTLAKLGQTPPHLLDFGGPIWVR